MIGESRDHRFARHSLCFSEVVDCNVVSNMILSRGKETFYHPKGGDKLGELLCDIAHFAGLNCPILLTFVETVDVRSVI